MHENIADRILEKINKRVEGIALRLATQYKGVRPFDSKELSVDERLQVYDQFEQNPQLMVDKLQREGREAVNKFIYENEMLLQKRRLGNARW